mgnify:CR=1 FL=1
MSKFKYTHITDLSDDLAPARIAGTNDKIKVKIAGERNRLPGETSKKKQTVIAGERDRRAVETPKMGKQGGGNSPVMQVGSDVKKKKRNSY